MHAGFTRAMTRPRRSQGGRNSHPVWRMSCAEAVERRLGESRLLNGVAAILLPSVTHSSRVCYTAGLTAIFGRRIENTSETSGAPSALVLLVLGFSWRPWTFIRMLVFLCLVASITPASAIQECRTLLGDDGGVVHGGVRWSGTHQM